MYLGAALCDVRLADAARVQPVELRASVLMWPDPATTAHLPMGRRNETGSGGARHHLGEQAGCGRQVSQRPCCAALRFE